MNNDERTSCEVNKEKVSDDTVTLKEDDEA